VDVPRNLRPGAFAGAAEAYARYRPPYPPELLVDLLHRAGVRPGGALLDLATGPGRVALDLAPSFASVIAVDIEPDMIAVARRRGRQLGIDNISWRVGRAEELSFSPESFDLVTVGEAFHRLEQARVAEATFRWLRPGACLATLGSNDRMMGDTPWEVAVHEVRRRWTERAFPDGWGTTLPGQQPGPEARERVLRAAGFVEVEVHERDGTIELGAEEVIGLLASTSTCSRQVLGDDFEAFEAELRAALGPDPSARYREAIRWGFTLARKPA